VIVRETSVKRLRLCKNFLLPSSFEIVF